PIIAAGPLAAVFAGGGAGGAVGAALGALVGYGIPDERVKLYERGINEGGIVMGVAPRSDADAAYDERGWAGARGEQVHPPGGSGRQGEGGGGDGSGRRRTDVGEQRLGARAVERRPDDGPPPDEGHRHQRGREEGLGPRQDGRRHHHRPYPALRSSDDQEGRH